MRFVSSRKPSIARSISTSSIAAHFGAIKRDMPPVAMMRAFGSFIFAFEPRDHSFDQSDITEKDTRAHCVRRIGCKRMGRRSDFDTRGVSW